jgi:hypothetical protein
MYAHIHINKYMEEQTDRFRHFCGTESCLEITLVGYLSIIPYSHYRSRMFITVFTSFHSESSNTTDVATYLSDSVCLRPVTWHIQ